MPLPLIFGGGMLLLLVLVILLLAGGPMLDLEPVKFDKCSKPDEESGEFEVTTLPPLLPCFIMLYIAVEL